MGTVISIQIVRLYLAAVAIVGWFALLLQLSLTIALSHANGKSTLAALITFFSFFTILTNLLVALAITCYLCTSRSSVGRFFARPGVRSALAVYIANVGAVYSLVLRSLWHPEGLQKAADFLLHDLIPVLYLLYWFFIVSRNRLPWKGILFWLLYPLAYLTYTLIRGAFSGWYPYPFVDANALGYAPVVRNSFVLILAFLALGAIMVAFTRWLGREPAPPV